MTQLHHLLRCDKINLIFVTFLDFSEEIGNPALVVNWLRNQKWLAYARLTCKLLIRLLLPTETKGDLKKNDSKVLSVHPAQESNLYDNTSSQEINFKQNTVVHKKKRIRKIGYWNCGTILGIVKLCQNFCLLQNFWKSKS